VVFTLRRKLTLRGFFALVPIELLAELLDPTGGVDELLLAREERMARRADFQADLLLGAAGRELVATRAHHFTLGIIRMNVSFHEPFPSFLTLSDTAFYKSGKWTSPEFVRIRERQAARRRSGPVAGKSADDAASRLGRRTSAAEHSERGRQLQQDKKLP
jgi:hypothetical protein